MVLQQQQQQPQQRRRRQQQQQQQWISTFEPSHEGMALFVLRKLILQTRMRSHPLGSDV